MKQEQEFHVVADRGYALGPEFVATYIDLEAAQQECARLNKLNRNIIHRVFVMEDVTDRVYSSTPIATEEELLKHRLSMVSDDIFEIKKYISNIESACDFNSDEFYKHKPFF